MESGNFDGRTRAPEHLPTKSHFSLFDIFRYSCGSPNAETALCYKIQKHLLSLLEKEVENRCLVHWQTRLEEFAEGKVNGRKIRENTAGNAGDWSSIHGNHMVEGDFVGCFK